MLLLKIGACSKQPHCRMSAKVHASSTAHLQHSVKMRLQGSLFVGGKPAKQHSVEFELL